MPPVDASGRCWMLLMVGRQVDADGACRLILHSIDAKE